MSEDMNKDLVAVDLVGDIRSPAGYARHIRELIKALDPHVDLRIQDRYRTKFHDLGEFEKRLAVLEAKTRDPVIRINFEVPPAFDPKEGIYNIGFTQWETTRLPDIDINGNPRFNWVKQMNRMDEMWTSSMLARNVFPMSGVEVPVVFQPGMIDTDFFRPGLQELPIFGIVTDKKSYIPRSERPAVVGMVAQWTERKDIEAFLTCMLSNFSRDEVIILLKVNGVAGKDATNAILEDRVEQMRVWVNNPTAPQVVVLTDVFSEADMARLYSSIDIYANTSRGEGLNLPLVEAMSSGCVVVSNGFSAPADYIFPPKEENYENQSEEDVDMLANGFLTKYILEPCTGVAGSPWYNYRQFWSKIDSEDFIRKVRKAITYKREKPEVFKCIQGNARQYIQQSMDYRVVGPKIAEYLKSVAEKRCEAAK